MAAKEKVTKKIPHQEPQPVTVRRESERELFAWQAPSRPFKKRTKEFWVSVFAIAAVISFILFLIEGPISVILVFSIVFLSYVLSTVEPDIVTYAITNRGLKIDEGRTHMNTLVRFWFGKRFSEDLVIFETTTIPGRLELVINPKDKAHIREALSAYLYEEEATPSKIDRTADWLSNKLPQN